jgi:glucosamine-phosphate N-acetyltransferase
MDTSVECPLNLVITELTGRDLVGGFLETLATLSPVNLTPVQAAEVFRNRLRSGVHTYVARLGQRVIGTASLLLEQKFLHGGAWVGYVEDVAVHRDYQKQGIGSALVRHATEEAQRRGCYKVILSCFEHLVPFYSRLGYRAYNCGMRHDC